jgi:uncharacterized membrane protein
MNPTPNDRSPLAGAGLLLGISLGGFFDGILLHQILQWHHLLSNVDAAQDLRVQLMADGLFHALMYLIAAIALHRLWRRRSAVSQRDAGRMLWGRALIGFGLWHIADAVLSHWVTGIHRIKMDSPHPLVWDIAWFVVFGLLPAVAGWAVARTPGSGHGGAAATSLALAAIVAGPVAALPAQDNGQTMVVFAPWVEPVSALQALSDAGARVLWVDRSASLWAVVLEDRHAGWRLHGNGALLVGNSPVALGCFSWTRAT